MKFKLEYHPAAKSEIIDSREWYDKQARGLGLEFLRDLQRAEQKILANPLLYPFYEGETRRILLDKFPFSLIYLFSKNEIQVVAIAHQRRKPKYWTKRIQ